VRAAVRFLKRGAVDLYWNFRGPRLRFPAVPENVGSVLFVCKGNICRSPFAEHVAQKLNLDDRTRAITFASAGLHVSRPKSPPPEAIRTAEKFGVGLDQHFSQGVSADLMARFDMVVAMEIWQWEELIERYPDFGRKFFVLPLLVAQAHDPRRGYAAFNIEDPYGRSHAAFEQCFLRIERCVGEFLTGLPRRH
jgi:protein-tyrosine phosphatase